MNFKVVCVILALTLMSSFAFRMRNRDSSNTHEKKGLKYFEGLADAAETLSKKMGGQSRLQGEDHHYTQEEADELAQKIQDVVGDEGEASCDEETQKCYVKANNPSRMQTAFWGVVSWACATIDLIW